MKREDFLDANGIVQAIETDTGIYGLFGKYRPLSNFHLEPIWFDGRQFQTSEAAYMSRKTYVEEEKIALASCTTGPQAKKLGQVVALRKDWEVVKESEMLQVQKAKYKQSEFCRSLLLSTGDKYIEESNWWGDNYWGKCETHGRNVLGQILMYVRSKYQ